MNILFILQYYKIGGVQTVTHVLSNKFVQEGHNCNVLTLTPSKGEEIHPILNSRIGVSVIDSHTLSTKEAIIQLRNFLIDKNINRMYFISVILSSCRLAFQVHNISRFH